MGYREVNKLFAESAGRCNFPDCRKILYHEYKDKTFVSLGEKCHIIGESPSGPRGHPKNSVILKKDEKNLILLCAKHHKIIDGNPEEFTVEILSKIKEDHLAWVTSQLDTSIETNWTLILHVGNINGKGIVMIDEELVIKDFIGTHILANIEKIEVPEFLIENNNWKHYKNNQEVWWKNYQKYEDKPKKFVICSINFIPLVIHLGYLLHDTSSSEIYQYNRSEHNWKWQEYDESNSDSIVFSTENFVEKNDSIQKLAVSISISAEIDDDDIFQAINEELHIIKIKVINSDRNWLKYYEQLVEFQKIFIGIIDKLRVFYPNLSEIHFFYAGPTPIAFIIGNSINPNIHPKIIIYNYHTKNKPKYRQVFSLE